MQEMAYIFVRLCLSVFVWLQNPTLTPNNQNAKDSERLLELFCFVAFWFWCSEYRGQLALHQKALVKPKPKNRNTKSNKKKHQNNSGILSGSLGFCFVGLVLHLWCCVPALLPEIRLGFYNDWFMQVCSTGFETTVSLEYSDTSSCFRTNYVIQFLWLHKTICATGMTKPHTCAPDLAKASIVNIVVW